VVRVRCLDAAELRTVVVQLLLCEDLNRVKGLLMGLALGTQRLHELGMLRAQSLL